MTAVSADLAGLTGTGLELSISGSVATVTLARPERRNAMTPGMWRAHAAMMRARRTCPTCRRDAGYVIPPTLGMCVTCAYPEEQHAA